VGIRLLRLMGWREGHGVGARRLPKKPRLGGGGSSQQSAAVRASTQRTGPNAAAAVSSRRKFGSFVVEELREVRNAIRGAEADAEEEAAEEEARRVSDERTERERVEREQQEKLSEPIGDFNVVMDDDDDDGGEEAGGGEGDGQQMNGAVTRDALRRHGTAPANAAVLTFVPKSDQFGLGFDPLAARPELADVRTHAAFTVIVFSVAVSVLFESVCCSCN
jgi:hypothetical protein